MLNFLEMNARECCLIYLSRLHEWFSNKCLCFLYRKYNEANMQEAVKWMVENVHANWGGTEILSVLEAIYRMPLEDKTSRQVIRRRIQATII